MSGIEVIPFKGPSLSHELYDSFGLKSSIDLDLLIKPDQVLDAEELLIKRGYKSDKYWFGELSNVVWKIFKRFNYHGGYLNKEARTKVELHWKLFASAKSFPKLTTKLFQDTELISVNGTSMMRLSKEDLIIYLSMHGTVHLWVRLKWLLDIRGFMI